MTKPVRRTTIVTMAMNPALDVAVDADVVRPVHKIRCSEARFDPGGGGINVARVAHALGASVSAVFPIGGPMGGMVADLLDKEGVPYFAVDIAGATRESFTVNERSSGQQFRFILPGPRLSTVEENRCLDELRWVAASAEFVVASGSLPPGVRPDFYQRVVDVCRELGALPILDASGLGLANVRSGAFLLKPSLRELREHTGKDLHTEAEQCAAAAELVESGVAQAVVLSLGEQGALLVTPHERQRFSSPDVPVVSGVGAGDAMVAAITVGLSRGLSMSESVRFGIAASAAMVTTPGTQAPTNFDVERLLKSVPAPIDIGSACR